MIKPGWFNCSFGSFDGQLLEVGVKADTADQALDFATDLVLCNAELDEGDMSFSSAVLVRSKDDF